MSMTTVDSAVQFFFPVNLTLFIKWFFFVLQSYIVCGLIDCVSVLPLLESYVSSPNMNKIFYKWFAEICYSSACWHQHWLNNTGGWFDAWERAKWKKKIFLYMFGSELSAVRLRDQRWWKNLYPLVTKKSNVTFAVDQIRWTRNNTSWCMPTALVYW